MKTTVITYALVLTASLVGAYFTWTDEDTTDLSGSTIVLDLDRDDLTEIAFESPSGSLVLESREDERGSYVWGRYTPPPTDNITPSKVFKVGAGGEAVLDGLAPFVAKRALEGIDDSKLEELGFGETQATLTIQREGKEPKRYEVAAKIPSRNRYVRDPEDGSVYVVSARLVQQLENGRTSLPDGSLFEAEVSDIQRVTVHGGEAEVTYVQSNPDDGEARFWSVEGSSDPNPAALGWFEKVHRLRVIRYLEDDARPAGLEDAFSLSVMAGKTPNEIVVHRAAGEDGETAWFATSSHNRGLVELAASAAEEVFAALPSVLEEGA